MILCPGSFLAFSATSPAGGDPHLHEAARRAAAHFHSNGRRSWVSPRSHQRAQPRYSFCLKPHRNHTNLRQGITSDKWPYKIVALSNNVMRGVQGEVTQDIKTDLGGEGTKKEKAVQYLCFLGTECSTSIRFPLSSTLPAKIKNQNKLTVLQEQWLRATSTHVA